MSASATPFAWRFDAIGTVWTIHSEHELPGVLRERVTARIAAFDQEWSRFRSDSLVAALARRAGSVPAPADAVAMLDTYVALDQATAGSINPLIGASLEALGYDRGLTLGGGTPLSAPADWRRIVQWNATELSVTEPALIDVGALGKGRLVDLVQAELAAHPGYIIVDAGGDASARGETVVALEHPYDATQAIGTVHVTDAAVCGSATNRRAWGNGLHHVLDARTGAPVQAIAATWAIADTAMQADAIASALFFQGGAEMASRWGAAWVRMFTDGTVRHSGDARVTLFSRVAVEKEKTS